MAESDDGQRSPLIKPASIAVVDDDQIGLEYFSRLLRRANVAMRGYAKIDIAIAELSEAPVPLLFVDYRMPKMNGLELIDVLHQSGKLSHTRTFLCTAAQPPDDVVRQATALDVELLLKDRLIDRAWVLSMIESTLAA